MRYYERNLHDGSWGVLGVPGRSVFYYPKGALTHHRAAGPVVVAFPLVRPCALRGGCGSCGSLQPMLPRLRSRSSLPARRKRCAVSSACENLPPAALSQRRGVTKMIALLSLLRKRNRKKNRGENDWPFTIWRQRSSAAEQAVPPVRLRPI